MPWVKQGRIFHLDPSEHRTTHCQVPTPYVMDDKIRVYYACRKNGMSFPAYFDLAKDLKTILNVHEEPIMEVGRPGMFDSDGVMPSCVIPHGNELWLYYIGWNARSSGARYQNEIGLAYSKDGETFTRMFEGPIMGRSPNEPGLAVMPFVMRDDGIFKMWYQSLTSWENIKGQYEPVYVIKYAESPDGIKWKRYPEKCIPSNYPLEAFSRPCVIKDESYRMWYCCRDSHDYRSGYGSYCIEEIHSDDPKIFQRNNDRFSTDFEPSGDWDSEMQAYPYVIKTDDRLVMFYNGNQFGQMGIGISIWE